MSLLELLEAIKKHKKLVIGLPIIFGALVAVFSWTVLPNTYTASVSMYVLANSSNMNSVSTENGVSLSNDLSASQMITNDVAALIESDRVLNESANQLGMDVEELKEYEISVLNSSTTRLISISIVGETPDSAVAIANSLANTTNTVAQEIMDIEAVNVIDQATVPPDPSGPNRPLYVAVALVAGLFVAILIVMIFDLINTRIRKPEEIEELLDIPVIGRIPQVK